MDAVALAVGDKEAPELGWGRGHKGRSEAG
jgi:hypothetical protein